MKDRFRFALLNLFHLQIIISYRINMVGAQDASTDKQALLFFKSIVSDPRGALSEWNLSSSHCTWSGVTCTKSADRVRDLVLPNFGLIGILAPQLSNLTSLELLDLSDNSFLGPIPPEFGRLSNLQVMFLPGNHAINGTIPPELGDLPRLSALELSTNKLSGAIPATCGNTSTLTILGLAENQLSGEIPTELGRLQNLRELQLSANHLSGEIPSSLYNISSLHFLSLTQNNLVGKLPSDIGHSLPRLTELYLASNKLEGPIPSSLSNASQLQVLELSSNGFTGSIPLLGKLKNLTWLHLGKNSLSSTTELNFQTIGSLANCSRMEKLMLESNQLAGQLPVSVGNLSAHLREFCVDDNFLTGAFPQGFEKYRNLSAISIHHNHFKGKIPSSIGKLKQLQRFMVHDNEFSGEIPNMFGNLTQLYYLAMRDNQFSGGFPVSLENCRQLFLLDLTRNKLTGGIPGQISGLSSLSALLLGGNLFSGSLPMEVGNLKQLEFLDVSANQISGNITTEIRRCWSLRHLDMAGNNLTGPIPRSLGELAALESLDLSSNSLSGSIPEELEKLEVLKKVNLSFNHLEGQVPRKGVFMNLSWDSLLGNYKLCGINQEAAEKLRVITCISEKKSDPHLLVKILTPVSVFVVVCAFSYFVRAWITQKRNKRRNKEISSSPLVGYLSRLSYSDIQHASDGFAKENLIGKGGFGSVYKAVFKTDEVGVHSTFAVKVLDLGQSKASKSFDAECEALRNIRHRNLVKVFTSCSSIDHRGADFKALVMEFMSNGNLDKWLYPEDIECGSTLTLTQRLSIAIDVASALDYLHHDSDPPVVHCDLKPGNVLLNDDMAAHVGDFGLARFLFQYPQQKESSTIGLKGSIGYIAPEYGQGGNPSTSGDVYSFGILLLEMFTTKKPTDEMFREGLTLNKFASTVDEKQIRDIADQKLFKDIESFPQSTRTSYFTGENSGSNTDNNSSRDWLNRSEECVAAVIRLGLSCAAQSPKDRLTMREALTKLQKVMKIVQG